MNIVLLSAAAFLVDGEVDLKPFRANPSVTAAVQRLLAEGPPPLRQFLEEIGLDPLRDVDRVKLRLRQPVSGRVGAPLAVLEGRFHPKRIHSSWAKNKSKTGIKAKKLHGKTSYEGSPGTPMFAVDSARRILVGHKNVVGQAIAGTLPKARKIPPFLRGAPVWMRFSIDETARRELARREPGSPMVEIHEVQLRAKLVGDRVKAKVRVRTDSPDVASGLSLMLSVGLTTQTHPSSIKLGRSMKTRVQGNVLLIDFDMRVNEMMALRPPPMGAPGRRSNMGSGGGGPQGGPGMGQPPRGARGRMGPPRGRMGRPPGRRPAGPMPPPSDRRKTGP